MIVYDDDYCNSDTCVNTGYMGKWELGPEQGTKPIMPIGLSFTAMRLQIQRTLSSVMKIRAVKPCLQGRIVCSSDKKVPNSKEYLYQCKINQRVSVEQLNQG